LQVHLLLRLRRLRLTRNRKGFSSIIGGIFMALIAMTLGASYFIGTLSQNTVYNDAIRQNNQIDSDRLSEIVQVLNTTYSVQANGMVTVAAKGQNAGPLSIQFVTFWIRVSKGTWANYNFTSVSNMPNMTVQAGAPFQLDGVPIIVPGASAGERYDFASWLITARGNVVALKKQASSNIIVAQVAQGIGSLALDFSAFRFFTYETSTRLANYSDGIKSFNVPSGTNIAFGALLTNLDPSEQTIILMNNSQLWIYFPQASGQTRLWYVVNVDPNGNIASSYSPIPIEYMETKLIVFASSAAGSFSSGSRVLILRSDDTCALNLLLLGTIGPRDYAQNIPFVSLYVGP